MYDAANTTAEKPQAVLKKDKNPDHFIVCEKNGMFPMQPHFFTSVRGSSGRYTGFQMTKRGVSGPDAQEIVADVLGVPFDAVSVQGRKDKWALTTQKIAVKGRYKLDRLEELETQGIWLQQLPGVLKDKLFPGGDEMQNFFSIMVHTDAPVPPMVNTSFRNVVGRQRFGDMGHEVGRMIIEGDFEQAADRLKNSLTRHKLFRVKRENGLESLVDALLHEDFDEQLGWEVLQWQSYLWNEVAQTTDRTELHLWSMDPEVQKLYVHLWHPDSVDAEIAEWYLQPRKNGRSVWVDVSEHKVVEVDGGYRHEFTLPSGAYATTYLATMYDYIDDSRPWDHKKEA